MENKELLNIVCILLLAIVVSVTLLTNFRNCEVLDNVGIKTVPCYQVSEYENRK